MDENRLKILNESNRMLSKLQLMSVFFGEDIIYKIYLRSQVIHQLFEANKELDINKLELFHLQFTASLLDLLRKIKKSNENNISLIFDEIQANKDMIDNLSGGANSENSFNVDRQRQASKVSVSLRNLYQALSDNLQENPLSKNINAFSSRYAADFFFNIPAEIFNNALVYDPNLAYANDYAIIQKKLLGVLCKYNFKIEFFYGFKSGSQIVEIYKFTDCDRFFLYHPANILFLFFDISITADLNLTNNLSNKGRLMQELKDKNDKLQSSAGALRSNMPAEIRTLLAENYKKIADINFLNNISNIDVQANILKTMLNTDLI